MIKRDELIRQIIIIIVGLVFIYLISYLSVIFSVKQKPGGLPPPPPEINHEDLPSPEEMLKSSDPDSPWTF